MQDRLGALETAVDDAVDHGLPPECARMLRDIVRILTYSVGRCWVAGLLDQMYTFNYRCRIVLIVCISDVQRLPPGFCFFVRVY